MTEPVNVTIDIASYGMPAREFIQWLRGGLGGEFAKVADDIEQQVKPAIDEPTEWGSVVRARVEPDAEPLLLTYVPNPEESDPDKPRGYPWYSEHDGWHSWDGLADVEVLRVGIGDNRGDVLPRDTEDYKFGQSDFAFDLLGKLRNLWSEAITSERKNAYEKAIQAVTELQP
jgi:hypothetical protein